MVFSSTVFLFFFLPIVLAVYYLCLKKRVYRNIFLTISSLFFYAWGEPTFVFVMLFSIAVNWFCGLRVIDQDGKKNKAWLVIALVFNIALLGVFKYLMFVMNNLNWMFGFNMPVPKIVLPIGISFFTFQAISYVVDVYRGDGQVQKKFMNVCLYISFFPQLIAGPIVRYQTVADEIEGRTETMEDFCRGSRRFMQGLAKKAILANNLALLVDDAFKLPGNELSVGAAWIAAGAYVLQTYFDFSGYSDMAIGLGQMFGFHFLENFNFPMLGRSMSGFWRRWHLSLGTWFRDYLFIPLGGSRVKVPRMLLNMFIVWSLTGLWHGAEWTFLIWGIATFLFLALERLTGLGKWMDKHPVGHVYTMAVILTISVIMKAENIQNAFGFLGSMYGFGGGGLWDATAGMYVREYGLFYVLSIVCSLPLFGWIEKKLHISENIGQPIRTVSLAVAFIIGISYIVMGGYNPFIYFNF